LKFFIPSKYYIPLSLSGQYCELNCPYCGGRFIRFMEDASTPSKLMNILSTNYMRGCRGFLLSGGFTKDGYLIISKEQLRIVKRFKKDHPDTVISIHLGVAPKELIEITWESGIDYIDFEVPPSNAFIKYYKRVKGKNVKHYIDTIEYAISLGGKDFLKPHIILNSKYSLISDELKMINELRNLGLNFLVLLIEIRNELRQVFSREDFQRFLKVLKEARRLFRTLSLGCMRPHSFRRKYDEVVIRLGLVDRVAIPYSRLLKKYNCEVIYSCCSVSNGKLYLFPKTIKA